MGAVVLSLPSTIVSHQSSPFPRGGFYLDQNLRGDNKTPVRGGHGNRAVGGRLYSSSNPGGDERRQGCKRGMETRGPTVAKFQSNRANAANGEVGDGGGGGAINGRVAPEGSEGEGNNHEQRVARKGSLTASKWGVSGRGVGWEVRESVEGKFA